MQNKPELIGPDTIMPTSQMGGSVWSWERGQSPWHRSQFPSELADQAPEQDEHYNGWYALDWCGNQIGFVPDGTPLSEISPKHRPASLDLYLSEPVA